MDTTHDDQEKLDELLDRWEESVEDGKPLSVADLCRESPHLRERLEEKIRALQKVDACFEKLSQAGIGVGPAPETVYDNVSIDANYIDLDILGRGGLGIVYRAFDTRLNRDVAIKFMSARAAGDEELRQWFESEAEITGRLDHPGVVPVFGMGQTGEGSPFYSMRLIRGETLDDAIARYHAPDNPSPAGARRMQLRQLLNRFATVCQTIAYAHTRGIIHRDIKPQNIMLGKYGETLVVDWGLAIPFQRRGHFRVLDEKTLLPRSVEPGAEVSPGGHGTPAFMSPEQASGDQQLAPASDIFSLGTTLYKILTGQLPFTGKSALDVKRTIIAGEFDPPRKLNRRIPPELNAIVCKALDPAPLDRYETALDLADDIERFLSDQPVTVYQGSPFHRMILWLRSRISS